MSLLSTIKKTGKNLEKAIVGAPHPDAGQEMDILDKLKAEHDEVAGMLKKLVDSQSAPERKSLLKKIKGALVPHLRAEDKVVYDAIIALKDKGAKQDGEEGHFEHDLAEKMLTTLTKIANANSPEFSAAAKVLKELVEHHVEEEEKNVWADVRKNFTDKDRLQMNRKFEAAKKKIRAN